MLLEKVKHNLTYNDLIKQGDQVVVGVSGGADSVCLLVSLYMIRKQMDFSITAAHVNHGLRGRESDRDEAFVQDLCEELKIPFKSKKIDVSLLAKQQKISIEEAGRNARYEFFRSICKDALIAVAHNKNDQEETILFNIARGTGLKGLSGMQFKNGDIIRPLLNISREEIEAFLRDYDFKFVTDSSNKENDYTRNKIRNNLLPYLKKEINSKSGEHLVSLGAVANETDDFINKKAKKFIFKNDVIDKKKKTATINLKKFSKLHSVLKKRVVYLSICKIAGSKKNIGQTCVDSVLELEGAKAGASVNLPYKLTAVRRYKDILIRGEKHQRSIDIDQMNEALSDVKVMPYTGQKISKKDFVKCFDYDKIENGIKWRFRTEGDVICLNKVGQKKLSRFMIDEKIPREDRDNIPLLADGNRIVWVYGYRINKDYKVTKKTKNIIKVKA